MAHRKLIIGSRGSALALWQARFVKKMLEAEYGDFLVKIKTIKTKGDKQSKTPLSEIGGKALFLKEIEEQILSGKVHMGVHSMKDVPTELPQGLVIGAVLRRDDPRDVLVSKKYPSLMKLPKRARIGTSSLRRQAQLKNFRSDLEIIPLRGNVETRLQKLSSENISAIVLASAGLERLGLSAKITEYLPTSLMLPAVAQGAIGIEILEENSELKRLLNFLNHKETFRCVEAERSFLKTIQGDCQSPVAAYSVLEKHTLALEGPVSCFDGLELIRKKIVGVSKSAIDLGQQLAQKILSEGGDEILKRCRR